MQGIILKIWTIFLWLFALSGFLTIAGITGLWLLNFFYKPVPNLPYMYFLISALIAEVIACTIGMAKYGFKYLPHVETKENQEAFIDFIKKFIKNASTVTIVSNRVSWINDTFISEIRAKREQGVKFKIIIPNQEKNDTSKITKIKQILGSDLLITGEQNAPEARFTLINSGRSGSERLAIAKGVYPDHEITVFDIYSGPQIIGMAKDIIRKSEEIAHATQME